ncbi:rhomboid family intramembrane serine protease [Arenimonas sp.]|uniref:rhomboid family intramembrane serine protease n=1 Tax=Arenimonas sp. TaxID=1872635 RepID=UPI002E372198|nr:rhomboid family intramembrane serine protease [Arenimonas sp.]HEX4854492.1 rhomboid family intramembrane serine protease [Arenimonas sp.]
MRLPPATAGLLWALGIGFLLQNFLPEPLLMYFALWPLGEHPMGFTADGSPISVGFLPWQVVSYGFLHGDFPHLLFNGLALFMFGASLEQTWGTRRFLAYFFICVAGAGLVQLAVVTSGITGQGVYPTIGASGGVFGLLLAYGMLFPNRQVMLLIPPIPMKARTFVIVFGAIELGMGVFSSNSGIAHFAHLGGMLFGWLVIRYWRGQPPFRPRGPRLVR